MIKKEKKEMLGFDEVNENAANAAEMPEILGFNDIHEGSIYTISNKHETFQATILNKHFVDEEMRLVFRREQVEYSVPFNWVSVDLHQ